MSVKYRLPDEILIEALRVSDEALAANELNSQFIVFSILSIDSIKDTRPEIIEALCLVSERTRKMISTPRK